jgi:hypothetical protein
MTSGVLAVKHCEKQLYMHFQKSYAQCIYHEYISTTIMVITYCDKNCLLCKRNIELELPGDNKNNGHGPIGDAAGSGTWRRRSHCYGRLVSPPYP